MRLLRHIMTQNSVSISRVATEITFTNSGDFELGNNSSLSTSGERVCSEGFYNNDTTGLCMPECGVSEGFPDAVVILSAVIGLLGGAVVLVFSCISYKRM